MRIAEITGRARSDYARSVNDELAYHTGFKPYLRVETEREVPSPIFLAAMLGITNLKAVPLPASTWTLPEDRRDQIVRSAIHQHYRRTQGRIPSFGRTIGYSLVVEPGDGVDLALPFDIHG